jgi:outer membrane immunogenic protein
MRDRILVVATALVFATPAFAHQDDPFTGSRVEAIAGWDQLKGNGDSENGVTYGAEIGYDLRRGNLTLGLTGEISGSSVNGCNNASPTPATPNFCSNAGRDLFAGARIGAVIGHGTLLHVDGGYTNIKFQQTTNDGTNTTTLLDQNLSGYRIGAGIERAFGSKLFGTVDYRYSDYQQGITRNQVLAGVGIHF